MSNGFLEGIVRGYKGALLSQANYHNLTQCENLEGRSDLSESWIYLPRLPSEEWMLDWAVLILQCRLPTAIVVDRLWQLPGQ